MYRNINDTNIRKYRQIHVINVVTSKFIVSKFASTYFTPLFISYLHDCTVLALLPIKKLIDWFKKPAQYLELKNKE